MTLAIEVENVSLSYGKSQALNGVSFRLDGGGIYGLIGRNGSGKSTLLALLAAFRQPTSGQVRIGGEPVWENARMTRQVCLVRESGDLGDTSESVKTVFGTVRDQRPSWDQAYADRLTERFGLPLNKKVKHLSRGQQSAVGIIVGLASRAPVTMFDEAYLGLDAPSRYIFYEEVLADFMEQPRTVLISTHLIEEVSSLFERTIILDHGKILLNEETEALRSRGLTMTGPVDVIDHLSAGMRVLNTRDLGRTRSVTVFGSLSHEDERDARSSGIEIGPVPLQDLFVHLTEKPGGES